MEQGTAHVGMDVHKRSIVPAMRDPFGAVRERTIPHEPRAIARWLRKTKREAPGPIRCAYEAGAGGGVGLERVFLGLGALVFRADAAVQCKAHGPAILKQY